MPKSSIEYRLLKCYFKTIPLLLILAIFGCTKNLSNPNSREPSSTADTAPVELDMASEDVLTHSSKSASASNEGSNVDEDKEFRVGYYKVQKNDTLMKIAFKIFGDINEWRNLYKSNRDRLKSSNKIIPGMLIKYSGMVLTSNKRPRGKAYLVKRGDSLSRIAARIYGDKRMWVKLWEQNKATIKNPNSIYTNLYIYYQVVDAENRGRMPASKKQ